MFNFKNLKMNLANLNLVDLNAQEQKEVEGGNPYVAFLALSLAYDICSNWSSSCKSFMAGYNAQL
jgi:hypothetical protein